MTFRRHNHSIPWSCHEWSCHEVVVQPPQCLQGHQTALRCQVKKRHRPRGEHIQWLLWELVSHAIIHIIITKIIKQVNILYRVIHTMLALDVSDSNITKLSNLQISRIIRENNHHHHSKNLIVQSSTFSWTVKSCLKPSRRTQ